MTLDSAPIPSIEPRPNSTTYATPCIGSATADTARPNSAADPAMPCISPTASERQRNPCS